MTLIVKIMSDENLPDDDPRKSYIMYGNVSSVAWVRQSDEYAFARMYIRDDVKTAAVPGFSEHEVLADIGRNCNAYVMNERGKTIGTFCFNPLGDNEENRDRGHPAPIGGSLMEVRPLTGGPTGDLKGDLKVDGTITAGTLAPRQDERVITVYFGAQNCTGITLLNRPYTGQELCREMGVENDRALQRLFNHDWIPVKPFGRYYPSPGQRYRRAPAS